VAAILSYDSSAMTVININPMMVTHINDISVRFKTHGDGLLFATSNHIDDTYFKLYMQNGQGVLETNIEHQGTVRSIIICHDYY